MTDDTTMISKSEAESEVGKAVRRLALLHLAFAETAVEELGDDAGRAFIVKAIRNYGLKIGSATRRQAKSASDTMRSINLVSVFWPSRMICRGATPERPSIRGSSAAQLPCFRLLFARKEETDRPSCDRPVRSSDTSAWAGSSAAKFPNGLS